MDFPEMDDVGEIVPSSGNSDRVSGIWVSSVLISDRQNSRISAAK